MANNSHSQEAEASGRRENQPNREPFFIELEWDGEGSFDIEKIARGTLNAAQRRTAERHYGYLRDVLTDPETHKAMLFDGGYFAGEEYADVRWRVINLPNLDHRLASRLAKTSLYADAKKSVSSLHPEITVLGGHLDVYGSAKLDALTEIGGYLDVSGSAKLDAPALTKIGGHLVVYGSAKLDAPALTKIGGYLDVYGSAKLDALTEIGGYLDVYGSAKLDAPALTKIGGHLDVREGATLIAPKLKKKGTAIK